MNFIILLVALAVTITLSPVVWVIINYFFNKKNKKILKQIEIEPVVSNGQANITDPVKQVIADIDNYFYSVSDFYQLEKELFGLSKNKNNIKKILQFYALQLKLIVEYNNCDLNTLVDIDSRLQEFKEAGISNKIIMLCDVERMVNIKLSEIKHLGALRC